jgi:hypothetical protein
MPSRFKSSVRIGSALVGPILTAALLLAGCVQSDVASRLNSDPGQPETGLTTANGGALSENPEEGGQIVSDLRLRQSILPSGSTLDRIAEGVIQKQFWCGGG